MVGLKSASFCGTQKVTPFCSVSVKLPLRNRSTASMVIQTCNPRIQEAEAEGL